MRKLVCLGSVVVLLAGSLAASTSSAASSSLGTISVVAGSTGFGSSGDGGPATAAKFSLPMGVAVDGGGNVYVADVVNDVVRRVATNGVITTVAGISGSAGFTGDGGPATAATLGGPWGLAVDTVGNLYIADSHNNRVRKVGTNGVITTVAGNGLSANEPLGDGGPATSGAITNPLGVAVDGLGELFITDGTRRIRKVDTSGVISTVAGNGTTAYSGDGGPATAAGLDQLTSVAVDASGVLYIATGSRVRKVGSNGVISTVVGTGTSGFSGDGGQASAAQISGSFGLAVDGSGTLYMTDQANHRVRSVSSAGVISTVAGSGTCANTDGVPGNATSAALCDVDGMAVDQAGTPYFTDENHIRIYKLGASGPGSDTIVPSVAAAATPVFTLRQTVSVKFSGADSGSGLSNFDVRYRKAPFNGGFGAWVYPTGWQHTTTRSVSVASVRGSTVCLSVRSRDKSGNVSAWSAQRCTAVALDDRSLHASSGWNRVASKVYYAGTATKIAQKSATLTRTGVHAKRLALVATRCPHCGTVGIYWNGSLQKQINLKAKKKANRQIINITVFGTVRTGTLKIKTLSGGRVAVDGVAICRT